MDRDRQPHSRQPVPAAGIRASDAERERAVAQLNQHVVEGRLTADEFAERVEAAYAARTRSELDALLVDLPVPVEPPPPPDPRQAGWRPPRPPVLALALIAFVVFAGWLIGMTAGWNRGFGPPFPFFPLFPILFWGSLLAVLASRASRPRSTPPRRGRR